MYKKIKIGDISECLPSTQKTLCLINSKPSLVVYACNSSTSEVEARRSGVSRQWLHREILSKKKRKSTKQKG